MCGIAGVLSKNSRRVAEAPLDEAISCLGHRGPDGRKRWMEPGGHCALAHSRLAIIDLDERSAQPFQYAERFSLVFNGELYNYIELREELRAAGLTFRTGSDTEVLAAAWMAWGPGCLERFDGPFAFAIWDAQEQCLFAARDRFGEKPFYIHYEGDDFFFASEMKALWTLGVPKKANDALAYNFLTIGYTANPTDQKETFYEGIWQLPQGHWLQYRAGDAELELNRFGEIAIEDRSYTDDDAIARFRELFSASVKRRLRSDVSVGTSLSGGLDSASVAAICRQQASGTYTHRAFTAVFPGFEKDEQVASQLIASKLGLQQQLVEIRDEEIPTLMERVQRHQEIPVTSASALAQFKVFEAVKKAGVTVLLDGQGADELLAGYEKFFRWHWASLYRSNRKEALREAADARALGIPESFGAFRRAGAMVPQFGAFLLEGRRARQAARQPGLSRDWVRMQRPYFYYTLPSTLTLNGVLYYHTFSNGLEELLRLADRNSMAHGVEVRLPFVEPELVKFVFTLSADFKIRNGRTKWLLRQAMEGLIPEEVLWQPRKTGFEPPQARWMALPAVQESIRAGKEKLVRAGVLDASVLQQKLQPHSAYAAAGMDWKYWSLSFLY